MKKKALIISLSGYELTKNELRSLWENLKMDQSLLIWEKPVSKKMTFDFEDIFLFV